jgi:hypothetical protein
MPLGITAATVSPRSRPSARRPWLTWLAAASSSPAVFSRPSGVMSAMRSGSACANRQKPSSIFASVILVPPVVIAALCRPAFPDGSSD